MQDHIDTLVAVFSEVRRVLRKDGTLWLNYGDCYAGKGKRGTGGSSGDYGRKRRVSAFRPTRTDYMGCKPKDLCGLPWRIAFALQEDGWYLRRDIIWHKLCPFPESVKDRPTNSHEYIFLLAKSSRYYYDAEAVQEPAKGDRLRNSREIKESYVPGASAHRGLRKQEPLYDARNLRDVWTVAPSPFYGDHHATFPPKLIEPCIKAGCPKAGTVLDPFGGAGTTGLVADRLGRNSILIELNPEYAAMAEERIVKDCPMFADVEVSR
jgi:DNA modification methylase